MKEYNELHQHTAYLDLHDISGVRGSDGTRVRLEANTVPEALGERLDTDKTGRCVEAMIENYLILNRPDSVCR